LKKFEKIKTKNLKQKKQKENQIGLSISKLFDKWFGKKEMRILMLGLDAAGKARSQISSYRRAGTF
jgi:hypothetical protein